MDLIRSDCKRAVNTLSNLNNEELDQYMSDDKLSDILNNLDQFYLKDLENEKESLIADIRSMAEQNLAKQPQLIEGRERIETLSKDGEELAKAVDEKAKEFRRKTGDLSLETALALLQTAASETEEESDQIARKFLDGDIELDEFLDQFLAKRKVMHLRLVKAEKLTKIVSRGSDPMLGNYVNTPPMNINTGYFPGVPQAVAGGVPYPTGPLNMPMPTGNYFQNHY